MKKARVWLLAATAAGCTADAEAVSDLGFDFHSVAEYGCLDCVGDELLGLVLALDRAPDGATAVVTASPPHVRLFRRDGSSSFGPSGDGPGELRGAQALAVMHDGRVIVSGRTLDVFDTAGTFLERSTASSDDGFRRARSVTSSSGEWAVHLEDAVWPESGIRLRLEGGDTPAARTIELPSLLYAEGEPRDSRAALRFAVSDDGRVALGTRGGDYRLVVVFPDGSTHSTQRDIPAPQRSEQELAELQKLLDEGPGAGRSEARPDKGHMGLIRFDERGRLWVQTARGVPGVTLFDLFDPHLRYLGEVVLEAEAGWFDVGGGEIVALIAGPLDVPLIRVWSIAEP